MRTSSLMSLLVSTLLVSATVSAQTPTTGVVNSAPSATGPAVNPPPPNVPTPTGTTVSAAPTTNDAAPTTSTVAPATAGPSTATQAADAHSVEAAALETSGVETNAPDTAASSESTPHPTAQPNNISPQPTSLPPNASASDATKNEHTSTDSADSTGSSVQLETPKPSQGHFIALGFHGIGAMAFDEDRGTRDPTFGNGFTLRLGESITEWLSVSLAFGLGDTYGNPSDHLTLGRFGITSQWYFSERWFAQAGFGAASIQGPDPEDHDLSRGRYGDVYLTGLGYNFYISDNKQSGGWVFTPMLTAEIGPDSKFTTASLSLGVEFSYWTGLTRDKLNLPTSKAYAR